MSSACLASAIFAWAFPQDHTKSHNLARRAMASKSSMFPEHLGVTRKPLVYLCPREAS